MNEILARRTYTSKTFQRDDGKRVSRCHAGHIHYKHDLSGAFTDVDLSWVDAGAFFVISGASYRLRVAKDFGAANLIQFQNRFEGAAHVVTYDPRRIAWITNRNFNTAQTIATQQSVQGVLNGDTIRYTDAFGSGIHFEISRKRSGFTKEVVIDSLSALGTPPNGNAHVAILFRYGGDGLTLRDDADQAWDGSSLFERSGRLRLMDAQDRPTFIAPARATDASDRQTAIPVAFVERPEGLLQVKILTRAILNNATYPLRADTTTQFYAGAGDGVIRHNGSATWATIHDAATGTSVNPNGTNDIRIATAFVGGSYFIGRGFLPIDTSGIPDTDVISAATLFLMYVTASSFTNDDNDGNDFLAIVGPTSQASSASLTTADFDQCGAVTNPAEVASRVDFGSLSTSTSVYQPFTLTDLSVISKTGVTLLGVREGHDALDDPLINSPDPSINRWGFATSEVTGTGSDPYLEVVHAAAGGFQAAWARGSNVVLQPGVR